MEKQATLRQQLAAFKNGQIMDSNGQVDSVCNNFFDWFCKDTSLRNKAIRLYRNVRTFVKNTPSLDLDKHYVFFKNNCLLGGSLYDDFRICDIESGDVIYNVTVDSAYTAGTTGHPKGVLSTHRNVLTALFSWELDARAAVLPAALATSMP